MELHDGDRDHLRAAAGGDLLRVPPSHDVGPDDGRGQGLLPGRRAPGPPRLRGSELAWAVAFVVPYGAVYVAFVVYPIAFGLWMARDPALYRDLLADQRYTTVVVN